MVKGGLTGGAAPLHLQPHTRMSTPRPPPPPACAAGHAHCGAAAAHDRVGGAHRAADGACHRHQGDPTASPAHAVGSHHPSQPQAPISGATCGACMGPAPQRGLQAGGRPPPPAPLCTRQPSSAASAGHASRGPMWRSRLASRARPAAAPPCRTATYPRSWTWRVWPWRRSCGRWPTSTAATRQAGPTIARAPSTPPPSTHTHAIKPCRPHTGRLAPRLAPHAHACRI